MPGGGANRGGSKGRTAWSRAGRKPPVNAKCPPGSSAFETPCPDASGHPPPWLQPLRRFRAKDSAEAHEKAAYAAGKAKPKLHGFRPGMHSRPHKLLRHRRPWRNRCSGLLFPAAVKSAAALPVRRGSFRGSAPRKRGNLPFGPATVPPAEPRAQTHPPLYRKPRAL